MPRIRQVHPKTRLLLVGGHPSPDLASLAGPGVTITGVVADVAPYYQQADIALAPLRAGGGTRLKILEAMARGRPVVSTSLGAEGLDVTHGRDLLLADTPKELAAAVLTLFGKPTLRAEIRAHARALVESRYNWDRCVREHLELYERLTEARRLKGPSRQRTAHIW